GTCRITAVDDKARSFVEDVSEGDLWLFPGGIPHSLQGLGPDGCFFLLVFNDGNFNEFETFLLSDFMRHVPRDVLAKNFQVQESTFDNLPQHELYIFASELPRPLMQEKEMAAEKTGEVPQSYAYFASAQPANATRWGGTVKIIDKRNFPVTDIAAAIITLKPGGLRELHWHPNSDEWNYCVSGKARVGVFFAAGRSRTMDFEAGDVGYIPQSVPHYIENVGQDDVVFLEVFPNDTYVDIALATWLAHTPTRLVNEHLFTGERFLADIPKREAVNVQDFALATQMAGVQIQLYKGGVRELHWHDCSQWTYIMDGTCRITLVDQDARSYVADVNKGDLWLFPTASNGCFILLVFNKGNFSSSDTFLITDWLLHVPLEVLAKNFQVDKNIFANIPHKDLFIFESELPRPLAVEKKQAAQVTGEVPLPYSYPAGAQVANYTRAGGSAKIIDKRNFPVTDIAAAIVTLKPDALRELHWHPNADEWNYLVTGKVRMGVFNPGGNAMTMNMNAGDIGYVPQGQPHWIENTGTVDAIFLEVFPASYYEDISLAEWLAHTPTRMANENIHTGEQFLASIAKTEAVIRPWNQTWLPEYNHLVDSIEKSNKYLFAFTIITLWTFTVATHGSDNLAPFMNQPLQRQNPLLFHPLSTDAGALPNFKYPFAYSHTAYYSGGWVNVQDFPIATKMAGVQMKLIRGGVRELHWHPSSEWAYVIQGTCRVTLVDQHARSFVGDVGPGDIWLFPPGNPHSIQYYYFNALSQGLGEDGCFFLLVFNDGSFSDFDTLLLTDWMRHVPLDVLALDFQVNPETFANLPQQELYMFASELPRPLEVEREMAAQGTGEVPDSVAFYASQMAPNYTRAGGSAKIIDKRNFPITDIAATIITLKPGALRELHWHPNADEWNYCVTGHVRLGVFNSGSNAMTVNMDPGDIGYVPQSQPHWFQNTGTEDAVMLEVFPAPYFEDISLAEWLAHVPTRLVNEHIHTGERFLNDFPLATQMSGVQMKIYAGAVREMHWHPQSEWAYVLEGTCRVTLIDPEGRSFVGDIGAGDLWLFPTGNPHSIQGLAPDGCFFLMVFNSGSFSDFDTLLLTQWMDHVPLDVLALNFQVPKSTFRNLPKQELYLFASELPRPLAVEKAQAAEVTGEVPNSVAFYASKMTPNYTRLGGSAKIIDKRNYPITDIAGTIITLKPGALRELHWHPNADEWNYCVTGHIRLGVFNAGGNAMTMDTYAGDIGYVPQAQPHWFQNIGKVDAVMLEVFPTPYFEDVSLAEWLAHTPTRLVEEHFHPGEKFLNGIAKTLAVIRPWNRTNNRDDSEFSTESSSQT
ncbi:unnamed protein product, partial [Medioppia subpectinata]